MERTGGRVGGVAGEVERGDSWHCYLFRRIHLFLFILVRGSLSLFDFLSADLNIQFIEVLYAVDNSINM